MPAPRGRPEAIIRPQQGADVITVERFEPSAAVGRYVEYFWTVHWDSEVPHTQSVVPLPRVHLVAEGDRLVVHGVTTGRFERTLIGAGRVVGAAFRPAAFRCVLGSDVSAIRESVVPAADLLGVDDGPSAHAALWSSDPVAMIAPIERYILNCGPRPDPVADEVSGWVGIIERDHGVVRVGDLAQRVGASVRTVQRLFAEYIGVGPQWVIRRTRVLEALAAAHHRGRETDWAALAAELGFADQPPPHPDLRSGRRHSAGPLRTRGGTVGDCSPLIDVRGRRCRLHQWLRW